MKKFTAILMAATMVLSLAACSSEEVKQNSVTATGEASSPADAAGAQTAESAEQEDAVLETVDSAEITDTDIVAEDKQENAASKPVISESEGMGADKGAPGNSVIAEPEPDYPETVEPDAEETEDIVIVVPETIDAETTELEITEPETTEQEEVKNDISDPTTLLSTTWALFGEDEQFPVTGGDFSSGELIEGAAPFGLADTDALDNVTGFPAAEVAKIDSAATLMHMMNLNTFTMGAYHVVEGTDVASLAAAVKDNIQNRMWCCGFPDKLIVVQVGDYLVAGFGKNDQINAFNAHLAEAYSFATVLFDEAIL